MSEVFNFRKILCKVGYIVFAEIAGQINCCLFLIELNLFKCKKSIIQDRIKVVGRERIAEHYPCTFRNNNVDIFFVVLQEYFVVFFK